MVQATEADVVRPPVSADDPDPLAHQGVGDREQLAGRGRAVDRRATDDRAELLLQLGHAFALCEHAGFARLVRVEDGVGEVTTDGFARAIRAGSSPSSLGLEAEAHAEPELGVVLEQAVVPRRPAPLAVGRPRRSGQVAAIDRRATGGIGDDHPVAEQLRHELDVWRLAAPSTGAGELEQRLERL